jgi:ubiquinone/menaquinone biosynthesis C-methylase UbiE
MDNLFSKKDEEKVISRYSKRLEEFGYSQKAVGWGEKGKQEIRFEHLASEWNLKNKSILDIGAGFGDLYKFLKPLGISDYTGIDVVPSLVEKGNEVFSDAENFKLIEGNILEIDLESNFDIAFISGTFNFKLLDGKNYEFIEAVLRKCMHLCKEGVCANFITDRVDYHEELIFNSKPEKILEIGLSMTKNIVFKQDCFPFEFSVFMRKDDSFLKETTIFNSYLHGK